jgi:hypothetical protein
MKIIDIPDSKCFKSNPDKKLILLSNGNTVQNDYKIKLLELRLYSEINQQLNPQSIITAYLETDKHSIEAKYEEGDLDDLALEKSAELLTNHLGLSGLILRLIISLDNTLRIQND